MARSEFWKEIQSLPDGPTSLAALGATPNGTSVANGSLFIDATNAAYGLVNDGGAADQTVALAAAIAATPVGGVCMLPPWKIKFSTLTIPAGVRLQGSGWSWLRDAIDVFGTAANLTLANYGGTVLISTAAAGTALTCATAATRQAGMLKDLLLLGPGAGTAVGVTLGAVANSSVEAPWSNVGIVNFATGAVFKNVEDCSFYDVSIRGCTAGLSLTLNTNNNDFVGLDVQRSSAALALDSTCVACAFYGPIFQSNIGTSVTVDGASHYFANPYLEGATATLGFDIVGGNSHKIDTPLLADVKQGITIRAAAARCTLINATPHGGAPITNAGTGTTIIGDCSALTDTGVGTALIDAYNGRSVLPRIADPLGLGFPTTSLTWGSSSVAHSAANYAIYRRAMGAGAVSSVRVRVSLQAGNVSVRCYARTGTGIAAKPGAALGAGSGSVSCPAGGLADIALGATVNMVTGDYFGISADGTTVALIAETAGPFSTGTINGQARMFYEPAAFPLPSPATPLATIGQSWIMDGV